MRQERHRYKSKGLCDDLLAELAFCLAPPLNQNARSVERVRAPATVARRVCAPWRTMISKLAPAVLSLRYVATLTQLVHPVVLMPRNARPGRMIILSGTVAVGAN